MLAINGAPLGFVKNHKALAVKVKRRRLRDLVLDTFHSQPEEATSKKKMGFHGSYVKHALEFSKWVC